jgi:hypothetical protein
MEVTVTRRKEVVEEGLSYRGASRWTECGEVRGKNGC